MKKVIVLTLMSALLTAGLVIAQPGPGGKQFNKAQNDFHQQRGMRPGGPEMLLKMADKLELTEKQTAQLKTMAVDFKLENIELKASIEKEQVLMKSLMGNGDVSEKEVFAKIDKISALKADGKKMQFIHKKAIDNLLTAEQTAKLKELRMSHKGDGMRGVGMRGHQPCDRAECDGHGGGFGPGPDNAKRNIGKN